MGRWVLLVVVASSCAASNEAFSNGGADGATVPPEEAGPLTCEAISPNTMSLPESGACPFPGLSLVFDASSVFYRPFRSMRDGVARKERESARGGGLKEALGVSMRFVSDEKTIRRAEHLQGATAGTGRQEGPGLGVAEAGASYPAA